VGEGKTTEEDRTGEQPWVQSRESPRDREDFSSEPTKSAFKHQYGPKIRDTAGKIKRHRLLRRRRGKPEKELRRFTKFELKTEGIERRDALTTCHQVARAEGGGVVPWKKIRANRLSGKTQNETLNGVTLQNFVSLISPSSQESDSSSSE